MTIILAPQRGPCGTTGSLEYVRCAADPRGKAAEWESRPIPRLFALAAWDAILVNACVHWCQLSMCLSLAAEAIRDAERYPAFRRTATVVAYLVGVSLISLTPDCSSLMASQRSSCVETTFAWPREVVADLKSCTASSSRAGSAAMARANSRDPRV